MKLYDIQLSLAQIEEFDPGTPEEKAAIEKALEGLGAEMAMKVNSIVSTIKGYEADADALSDEIARLQDRKRSAERRAESIRLFLRDFMISTGQEKIKTNLFTVSRRMSQPAVEIIAENLLPLECFDTVQVVNKKTIKSLLENGGLPETVARLVAKETISIR